MWISFLIPKIEDGNNFGVSIQEGICIKNPRSTKSFISLTCYRYAG